MANSTQPEIRVGATVFVRSRRRKVLAVVKRETKTQWVLEDGSKFLKSTARLVGEANDPWNWTTIHAATGEKIAAFREARRQAKLAEYLRNFDWSKLDGDTLAEIIQRLPTPESKATP